MKPRSHAPAPYLFFSHTYNIPDAADGAKAAAQIPSKAYVEKPRRFLERCTHTRHTGSLREDHFLITACITNVVRPQPLKYPVAWHAAESSRHSNDVAFRNRRSCDDRLRSRAFRIADEQRRQSIPVEKRYVKHDASKHQRYVAMPLHIARLARLNFSAPIF